MKKNDENNEILQQVPVIMIIQPFDVLIGGFYHTHSGTHYGQNNCCPHHQMMDG